MSSSKKRKIRRELVDFLFVLPAIIVFILVIILPLVNGVRYSFTDWNGMSRQINLVGLKNYITILHDKDLIKPICNTALYTVVTTLVINVLGLAFAMMVVNEFKGVNVIKSIIFVPLVVSLVLVSYMWMYVYSDFLGLFGMDSPLIHEKTVMLGLCAMAIWKETGLAMMIYLAALKNVPSDYYEAATIDGAGFWQKFRNITVPMIAPAFTYCIPYWIAGTDQRRAGHRDEIPVDVHVLRILHLQQGRLRAGSRCYLSDLQPGAVADRNQKSEKEGD